MWQIPVIPGGYDEDTLVRTVAAAFHVQRLARRVVNGLTSFLTPHRLQEWVWSRCLRVSKRRAGVLQVAL